MDKIPDEDHTVVLSITPFDAPLDRSAQFTPTRPTRCRPMTVRANHFVLIPHLPDRCADLHPLLKLAATSRPSLNWIPQPSPGTSSLRSSRLAAPVRTISSSFRTHNSHIIQDSNPLPRHVIHSPSLTSTRLRQELRHPFGPTHLSRPRRNLTSFDHSSLDMVFRAAIDPPHNTATCTLPTPSARLRPTQLPLSTRRCQMTTHA